MHLGTKLLLTGVIFLIVSIAGVISAGENNDKLGITSVLVLLASLGTVVTGLLIRIWTL